MSVEGGIRGNQQRLVCPKCGNVFFAWRPDEAPGQKIKCYFCRHEFADEAAMRPVPEPIAPPPAPAVEAVAPAPAVEAAVPAAPGAPPDEPSAEPPIAPPPAAAVEAAAPAPAVEAAAPAAPAAPPDEPSAEAS